MCLQCWDADERKIALMSDDCDGKLSPFMTLPELKAKIAQKWHRTKKTSHVVYKEAIINPPTSSLIWTETIDNQPVKLTVRFVNF